jgi:hypothetical protein
MSINTQFKKLFYYSLFRNSKAVSIGIAAIVLVVGGLWVLYPKFDLVRKKGLLTYDSKKLQLQHRTEYLNKINTMLESYRSIDQDKIEMADRVLPGEKQIPELFVMLDQLGRDLGARVSRIAFSSQEAAPAKSDTATTAKSGQAAATPAVPVGGQQQRLGITLGLDFDGAISYSRYKEVLDIIEQNVRIMDLSGVNYDNAQNTMTLNLTTYYLERK